MAHRTSGGRRHGRRSSISSGAATTLPTTSSTKCATKAGSNGRRPGERRISACAAGARGRTPPAPAAALIGLERPIISKRSRALVWRFGWLVNHVKATSAAGSSFLSKRGILNRLAFKGGTCLRTMLSAARDNFRPSWISRESRSGP
jgi:hypothetical protein